MSNRKNSILMIISFIFLVYAFFLSVYPAYLTSSFNIKQFEEKITKTTALIPSVRYIDFKMTPGFTLIITLRKVSVDHPANQHCFDAELIELRTNPLAPVTKNFKIKKMNLEHVTFINQVFSDGKNKLHYLPQMFEASEFGANEIVVKPGPVEVRDFKLANIISDVYSDENRKESSYTKEDVREFLQNLNFRCIKVK